MARALFDPILALILAALLIAILLASYYTAQYTAQPPAEETVITTTVTVVAPTKLAELECKAGPLTVHTVVVKSGDNINVIGTIQPPNPCYNITSLTTSAEYKADNTLVISVKLAYTEPPPGTVCIQVLPPPTPFTINLPPPLGKPTKILLEAEATANGKTYTCRAEAQTR